MKWVLSSDNCLSVTGKNKSLCTFREVWRHSHYWRLFMQRWWKKMLNIDKNVREFWEKCQSQMGKRCMEKENFIFVDNSVFKKPREAVFASSSPVTNNNIPNVELFPWKCIKTLPQILPKQVPLCPEPVELRLKDITNNTISNLQVNCTQGCTEHDYGRKQLKLKNVQHRNVTKKKKKKRKVEE